MPNNKVTMKDVAEHAGVSKSTVSQYLNQRYDYMGTETRKRIEEAIDSLNYQPNVVARSLKVKKTSTIGVIVANILHSFSTQVIRAIEDHCNEEGFSTIICNADDQPDKEKKYIETLLAKQVDGLLVFPTGDNIDMYERLMNSGFPVVFLDRPVSGMDIDTVMLNNEHASELAVDHLLQNGYENIAIMTTSLIENIAPRIERIEGYKRALAKRDLPIHSSYIKGMEISDLFEGLEELTSLKEPPDAIISGNDLTLMEILKFTSQKKICLGEELGLITIDEVPYASVHSTPLTTIAQPTFDMGRKAAQLLIDKIKNEYIGETSIHRFEPTLITRESSVKN